MGNILYLTERELTEIKHALWYERFGNHGTVGHNMLIIIAKMARFNGFDLGEGNELLIPDSIEVVEK